MPIATLQSALWNQSVLRHQITSKPKSPATAQGPSSPLSKDKELGIAFSTNELSAIPDTQDSQGLGFGQKMSYPIPGDSSWRMGDNGDDGCDPSSGPPISMEDLFAFSHSPCIASARQSSNRTQGTRKVATDKDAEICSTEATFFGLKRERYISAECASSDRSGTRRWTSFPPCRFGVEFWDIDTLKEKSRLHSQTVWCAGSLFNIYLQIVKKKGQPQLGIYLYRQSTVEAIPPASAPYNHRPDSDNVPELLGERPSVSRGISYPSSFGTPPIRRGPVVSLPALESRSVVMTSSISPPSTPMLPPSPSTPGYTNATSAIAAAPHTSSPVTPQQPYRDPRSSISAYFMISCASATGSSQMRFTSAPDLFAVGQSWGWKTSSLRTEEYMEVGENATAVEHRSPISSLRATVVLGLI